MSTAERPLDATTRRKILTAIEERDWNRVASLGASFPAFRRAWAIPDRLAQASWSDLERMDRQEWSNGGLRGGHGLSEQTPSSRLVSRDYGEESYFNWNR